MSEIYARLSLKHDSEANWAVSDFIPNIGEVIIYDSTEPTIPSRAKIGDGKTQAKDLPFLDSLLRNEIASMTYVSAVDTDGDGNIVLGVAELPYAEDHSF